MLSGLKVHTINTVPYWYRYHFKKYCIVIVSFLNDTLNGTDDSTDKHQSLQNTIIMIIEHCYEST